MQGEEGFYALCEGSKLRNSSSLCKLSKTIDLVKEANFQFWYFMYGNQIGTLELIVNESVIWHLTGKQDNDWLLAQIKLPVGNYLVKLNLEFLKKINLSYI